MKTETVLVTGGSGFIGSYVILRLLSAGYRVRTTVRDLKREPEVRAMLKQGGAESGDSLSFFAANLSSDEGWAQATAGCTYVIHVASPTPLKEYRHEDELIIPAREGVLRVLRAARDAGVKRVVLTSSFGAIGLGHAPRSEPLDETTWTNLNGKVPAYQKSKTLAEKAAWDFIANEGRGLELSTVNPTGVLGPVLSADYSHSIVMIQRMLDGKMPGCPKISSCFVDVRDVADLHVLAMTDPKAKGERFLAAAGESLSILGVANVLRAKLGAVAERVPKRELPNLLVRLAGLRDPVAREVVPQLGKVWNASSEKARRVLGWKPRSNEEAIVATGQSLVTLGLLERRSAS
ncbi:MAG: aldehyde reductase [Archangium sp.]